MRDPSTMDDPEYYARRAWQCYRLAKQSGDEPTTKSLREMMRDFVVRALDSGMLAIDLPPLN